MTTYQAGYGPSAPSVKEYRRWKLIPVYGAFLVLTPEGELVWEVQGVVPARMTWAEVTSFVDSAEDPDGV